MLMGGVNSAGAMQSYMRATFGDLVGECVEVYIGNVIIHSAGEAAHQRDVEAAMGRVHDDGWTLRREKCVWNAPTVENLGHVLHGNGVVSPKSGLIRRVVKEPTITSADGLREFLGRAGYYHRFMPGYANAVKPLFARSFA